MILGRPLTLLLLAAAALAAAPAVRAQEPLYLRIRANPAPVAASGSAPGEGMRESVWARSDRRARIVIASVCTGCLPPAPALPPAGGPAVPPAAFSLSTEAVASVTTPPPTAGDP